MAILTPDLIQKQSEQKKSAKTGEILPVEDLMREHGVLDRVLLIYEDIIVRIGRGEDFPRGALAGASETVRDFIGRHHEHLEETYVFPWFRQIGKLVELVNTLHKQHEGGRHLVSEIIRLSLSKEPPDQRAIAGLLAPFIRMYRPHKAYEDTVLFPAFHATVPPEEYRRLGEQFGERERELFGENAFENMTDKIAALEDRLGLGDLAKVTPSV